MGTLLTELLESGTLPAVPEEKIPPVAGLLKLLMDRVWYSELKLGVRINDCGVLQEPEVRFFNNFHVDGVRMGEKVCKSDGQKQGRGVSAEELAVVSGKLLPGTVVVGGCSVNSWDDSVAALGKMSVLGLAASFDTFVEDTDSGGEHLGSKSVMITGGPGPLMFMPGASDFTLMSPLLLESDSKSHDCRFVATELGRDVNCDARLMSSLVRVGLSVMVEQAPSGSGLVPARLVIIKKLDEVGLGVVEMDVHTISFRFT